MHYNSQKWLSPKRHQKTRQKFNFGMEPKTTTLLPTMLLDHWLCFRFVAVAFWSEEEVCWRRGPLVTYFGPALDPPLGGSGRKTTTLVRDHEYFIPTKFHQNPSSGSAEEVENVKSLRRTDEEGRRTDGRRTVRYDNSSLVPSAQGELKYVWIVLNYLFFLYLYGHELWRTCILKQKSLATQKPCWYLIHNKNFSTLNGLKTDCSSLSTC